MTENQREQVVKLVDEKFDRFSSDVQ